MIAMNKLVAVYGSLKTDGDNHHYLQRDGAEKLGEDRVRGWAMFDLVYYPTVVPETDSFVTVEVYEIEDRIEHELDVLEGHPAHYNKTRVKTKYGEAIMYMMQVPPKRAEKIESGHWDVYEQR